MSLHIITGIIKNTIMITSFVMVMMLIIEYINVQTKGSWSTQLRRKGWLQIVFAAFLGIIPGCLGAYTAVSLYAHKIFSFAALVTVMIATSGDEAFFMISVIPKTTIILTIIIFGIAILSGFVINFFMKNKTLMVLSENHMKIHNDEADCICFNFKAIIIQLKKMSMQRAILIAGLVLFIFGLLTGDFGHNHDFGLLHGHEQIEHDSEWNWVSITFLIVSFIALFIIVTVNDHFLEEHLWGHIIKKHFLKIFLWTFATLLLLNILNQYLNIEDWIKVNQIKILIIAVLIGIIPQSGPHFIFIFLFANGTIPFSILLANSIVQDGHGAIPLLAESRKSFFAMKAINILVGLIVGIIGFYVGF
ncbi:MAG: arsenic efflux protein [Bacteroidales bacterium]|nr:arsenic efflux protein [Bacteroidales bacterium]